MGKKQASTTPASGMKQKSIAAFFAAKPKPGASGTGTPPTKPSAGGKENAPAVAPSPAAGAAQAGTPQAQPASAQQPAASTPAAAAAAAEPEQAARASGPPASAGAGAGAGAGAAAAEKQKAAAGPSGGGKKKAAAKGASAPAAKAAAADRGSADRGASLVGRRVRVFWPLDQDWYEGVITAHREEDGCHHVSYEDGDDEWVDLVKERHTLLPRDGAKPGAAAAAARKRRRKVLASDSEDDDDDDDDDDEPEEAGGSDDDSDFKADGDESDDAVMEELEEEADSEAAHEAGDDDSDSPTPAGSKRKRPASKAARKKRASPGAAGASAGAKARAAPSSAGHTPMERSGAGDMATPPAFPGFTPPAATRDGEGLGTPPSLGFFSAGGRGGSAKPGADATPGSAGGCGSRLSSLTPDSAAKAALQDKLDLTPGVKEAAKAEPKLVLGVVASGGSDAARFAARMAERYTFLHPSKIRDKAGKRPDDPDYNPRSLRLPDDFFKKFKVTEAQQQWWRVKADHFDSVVLFKVGKFYELFEMDAFVGVDVLGLAFMKGDQPHAGFPEAAYHGMAEQLARAGYRVVVVEQTERPEQLKARQEAARRSGGPKAGGVVKREAVAVLSRGTLIDPEMVATHPDAAYVLAVVEVAEGSGHDAPFIGACALDAAAGQLLLGSWRDDEVRLKLRTQLTGLRPVEVVLPRRGSGAMSATTSRLVRCGGSRGAAPALNELRASAADADAALQALAKHFPDDSKLPPLVAQLREQYQAGGSDAGDAGDAGASRATAAAGLAALGLMVEFLTANMLAAALLPHARYEPLCDGAAGSDEPVAMELNGAALEGLEVLENALGGPQGSLLGLLDHCATPFGRRRLRRWLTRPLYRAADIERRQDAVEELMGPACDAVSAARRALAGCSDLERSLARLAASVGPLPAPGEDGGGAGGAGGFGREAAHVVLYEDVARKRLKVLVDALKDLAALRDALVALQEASPNSELLAALSDASRWADFGTRLDEMSAAADWDRAHKEGVVRPARRGVDAAYDSAQDAIAAADEDLQAYLARARKQLDCRSACFISLNKDSHVLEVPEATRAPAAFSMVGHRKGFKRYTSDELAALVAARNAALEERERVEASVLRNLERLFVSHADLWSSAIEAVGIVDCLMALAGAALAADGVVCRPRLLAAPAAAAGAAGAAPGGVFRARQLRHPAGVGAAAGSGGGGAFVPNDISLGGDAPGLILLTGPNMGGKSTLLRQVCLAAVLAQVGAMVPAESLELTPMDGCFVRMGARDAILRGQSTFYIEMAETAAMLARATPRSLVALDELGRGTATLDGAAIAAAVLDQLVGGTRCCGLFATHYHQLAAEHAADSRVAIMHMACAVAEAEAPAPPQQQQGQGQQQQQGGPGDVAEVTFLYQLTPGACPKSYGTNVARLAGLPASVVLRAAEMSASREAMCGSGGAGAGAGDAMHADGPSSGAGSGPGGAAAADLLRGVAAALKQLQAPNAADGALQRLAELQQQAARLCAC